MMQPNTCGKFTWINEDNLVTFSEGINALNHDCLVRIFQYLSIVDRIRIERVCKRWQISSQESWRNFHTLGFDNSYWGFKKLTNVNKINARILKKVLHRCGQFIFHIKFDNYSNSLGPNVLTVIAKNCPNIKHLHAAKLLISSKCIQTLAKNCSKLLSFLIGDTTDTCELELAQLFAKNQKLQEFGVYENSKITGLCLMKLNKECIRSIIFEECTSIRFGYFNIVKTFSNLEVLAVEHFHYADNCCNHISNFVNLNSLDLSFNISVNDAALAIISANCKMLKKVDISYCYSVTNDGVSKIVTLPKLTSLTMENLDQVTDSVFKNIFNLTELDCSYCTNVRDPGLIKLIECSDKIEHLYLCFCMNVTNELLDPLIKATQKRSNNVVLKLYLSHTNVKVGQISDTSPFLQIVPLIIVNRVNRFKRFK